MRALSPAVLERYVTYLAKHRKQADGSLRNFDNWKQGIPQEVYLDSLLRHTKDLWSAMNNEPTSEPTTAEDLVCAVLFNAQGLLFEMLVARGAATRENCTPPAAAKALPTCGDCVKHSVNGGVGSKYRHAGKPGCYCSTIGLADRRCFVPKVPA